MLTLDTTAKKKEEEEKKMKETTTRTLKILHVVKSSMDYKNTN